MNKVEEGEKYLSISLLGNINLAAFKNKNKQGDNSPDYKGNGISIWVKTKKSKVEQEEVNEI